MISGGMALEFGSRTSSQCQISIVLFENSPLSFLSVLLSCTWPVLWPVHLPLLLSSRTGLLQSRVSPLTCRKKLRSMDLLWCVPSKEPLDFGGASSAAQLRRWSLQPPKKSSPEPMGPHHAKLHRSGERSRQRCRSQCCSSSQHQRYESPLERTPPHTEI